MHAKEIEAMARATCCPDGCEVIGCRGRLYVPEATAALTALCTLRPDVAAVLSGEAVVVPRELDEVAAWSMREAFRSSRRGGISGMSLDAQFKVGFAPEIAAYRAMLAASPYAKETPDAR